MLRSLLNVTADLQAGGHLGRRLGQDRATTQSGEDG